MTTPPPNPATIKVAIVEDSSTLRRNVERWLNRTEGFKCVAACDSAEEGLTVLPEKAPDVVLMDIQMPGMSGVECTAQLKQLMPEVQIMMLTVYEDTDTIFSALKAGASGFLLKRTSLPDIVKAIQELRDGGAPMSNAIARKIVAAFQQPAPQEDDSTNLTAREREILDWLVKGYSNKEISAKLDISPFTVKVHMTHIFEKLHVRSRVEAAVAYLEQTRDRGASRLPEAPNA